MCRWWRRAWHAYKSKPCTLEWKPPPACSLACQVSHLTVPPFGKTQAGNLVTRGHPPAAHDLHTLWSAVDCCARASRETDCLVSERKDACALPAACTVSLLCPLAFLVSETVLPCTYALLLPAKGTLNCRRAGPSSNAGPLQKASGCAGQRAEPGCPAAPPVRCPAELHAVQPWTPPSSGLSPHTESSAQSRYNSDTHSSSQV